MATPSSCETCSSLIRFVGQGPDFLLSQIIPALVDRDLIEPGGEGRAHVKTLERDVDLHKNLLDDIFDVFATAQNAVDQAKDALLMAADQLLEFGFAALLGRTHQFAVAIGPRTTIQRHRNCLRTGCHILWDVGHTD